MHEVIALRRSKMAENGCQLFGNARTNLGTNRCQPEILLSWLLVLLLISPYTGYLDLAGFFVCFRINIPACWNGLSCDQCNVNVSSKVGKLYLYKKWSMYGSQIGSATNYSPLLSVRKIPVASSKKPPKRSESPVADTILCNVSTFTRQQTLRFEIIKSIIAGTRNILKLIIIVASLFYEQFKSTGVHSSQKLTGEIKCPFINNNIVSSTFDHNGGVLTSNDGIKVTIPKGAIRDGDLVPLYIVVDSCGPFVFPTRSQTDLVSPYYWIGVSYHFQKPVQVEFEHYAVINDLSHYQLLSCKDDDKSYTMQPVDCKLSFTVQGGKSWCTFHTYHFCSYCLYYEGKGEKPNTKRIGIFCLKPANFQSSNVYKVKILLSFDTDHCIGRIKELGKKEGLIFDKDNFFVFETSSDESSTSYVKLEYEQSIYGWYVDFSGVLIIETKKINFHNDYKDWYELYRDEERSSFPPRFNLIIRKNQYMPIADLHTNITITIFHDFKEKKLPQSIKLCLFVSMSGTMKNLASTSGENYLPSVIVGEHHCNKTNKPNYTDLSMYSEEVAPHWERIAAKLKIDYHMIEIINADHHGIVKKCCVMFRTWLQQTRSPCWCNFIHAVFDIRLYDVAEDAKKHLKLIESTRMPSSNIGGREEGNPQLCCESSTMSENTLKNADEKLTLHDFVRYLQRIPDEDLKFFITQLIPNKSGSELIKTIRRTDYIKKDKLTKEDKLKKIYEVFLKVKDPSWTKVHDALQAVKSPGCDNLAGIIGACFLPLDL